MTTQIKIETADQAYNHFDKCLAAAGKKIDESHHGLIWAILDAIDSQDTSILDKQRESVMRRAPALVKRFDSYVLFTIDGIALSGDGYAESAVIALSECASLGTPWNTPKPLTRDKPAPKPADPREDITRTINKMNKCARGEAAMAKGLTKAKSQLIADILAQSKSDIEAVFAGTYKVAAQRANNADVANVTPIKKTKAA